MAVKQRAKRLRHSSREYPSEYSSWKNMLIRCFDKHNTHYKEYGGRGITVCERWRESFDSFVDDMGKKPFPEASIERVNNDGNYTPSNCIWADRFTQARNKRNNHIITVNGETAPISVFAERNGISGPTISWRVRNGWTPERAVSAPLVDTNKYLTWQGVTKSVGTWAREVGMTRKVIKARIDWGWSVGEILTIPVSPVGYEGQRRRKEWAAKKNGTTKNTFTR